MDEATRARLEEGMKPIPVVPTDEEEAEAYFHGYLPQRLKDQIRGRMAMLVQELRAKAGPGDEVWRYRSKFIGDLAGHEGLALVRNGEIVEYTIIRQY